MEVQSVAIRYPALDQSAGESQGMRPIVFSAEQGLCGATLQMHGNISNPLQAGFDKSQKSIDTTDSQKQAASAFQQFQIDRIIFLFDRSGSMGDPLLNLHNSKENKLQHIISQFSKFPSASLQNESKISLVSFNDSAIEHMDRNNLDLKLTLRETKKISAGGGTSFLEPFQMVKEILEDDRLITRTDNRSLVVFLTDGHDNVSHNSNGKIGSLKAFVGEVVRN